MELRLRIAIAGLAALAVLLTVAPMASAHADFVSSTPAPYDIWNISPTYVSVTVSEAVQPGSPVITVTNQTDVRVDRGPTQLSPTDPATFSVALQPGIGPSVYTVTWSVVSADDGHFTAGTFYFMVTNRDGTLPGHWPQTGTLGESQPISPLDVSLRAVEFLGFSIVFGGTLLAVLLWIPGSSDLDAKAAAGPANGLRVLLRFAELGALLFALAEVGLWIENLYLSPPSSVAAVFGSLFLASLVGRAALGFAMAILVLPTLVDRSLERRPSTVPRALLLVILLGFVVILLEVAASHSATIGAWFPLGPVADATHLYGAALWIGGLLALVRVRRWLRDPTPPEFSRAILAGFSRLAYLGVVLVVSAGVLLAVVLVGTLNALIDTGYGWVILAKGALLVPMVFLGWWSRRILRRGEEAEAPRRPSVARVARNVRAEALVGIAVLVLAGLLVTMNPAAAPTAQNATFTLAATAGGLYSIFSLNPWPAGPGSYIFQFVYYYAGNGTAYLGGGNGTVSFLLEGGNGTWVTLPLDGPHGNHYFTESSVMDAPGTWQIRPTIRAPVGTPLNLTFSVTLHS